MGRDVNWYLARGFERPYAEYFASGIRRIEQVEPMADYTLLLLFDNGERRRFDMAGYIQPETVFAFLRDEDAFSRVYIDDDGAVAWDKDSDIDSDVYFSNKVDISPETVYVESVPVHS